MQRAENLDRGIFDGFCRKVINYHDRQNHAEKPHPFEHPAHKQGKSMALQTIRAEGEVIERYDKMRVEGRDEAELDEYLRQMSNGYADIEDYRDIDHTAKNYLGYTVRNIGCRRWPQVRQAVRQFVAWKWMLGHEDADTFPGADAHQGQDPRQSCVYLRDQIQSGEWDRMTKEALERSRRQPVVEIPPCKNLCASEGQFPAHAMQG